MNRNIDEREAASRATISDVAKNGCHHTGGGRMDDLRHFPHAPRDERELAGTTQSSVLVTAETREGVGRETDTPREKQRLAV